MLNMPTKNGAFLAFFKHFQKNKVPYEHTGEG